MIKNNIQISLNSTCVLKVSAKDKMWWQHLIYFPHKNYKFKGLILIKEYFLNSIESITDVAKSFMYVYDSHIKEKAIKEINKKIQIKGLYKETIEQADYEVMVGDLSKYFKEDYTIKVMQGLMVFIGFDVLF